MLERIPGLLGPAHVWRRHMGGLFDAFEPFLSKQHGEYAEEFPCENKCGAGCPRQVIPVGQGHEAVCRERRLEPIPVELSDLTHLTLDMVALAPMLAPLLRFKPGQTASDPVHAGLWRIGMSGDGAMPVLFLADAYADRRRQTVRALLAEKSGPFCLIVPSADSITGDVLELLQRRSCVALRLSECVALHANGALTDTGASSSIAVPIPGGTGLEAKGVTMYDLAYAIDMDEELAQKRVAKWRRHHKATDFPGYIGPHPHDSRKKLYNPTPLLKYLRKIDNDIQDSDDAYIARLSDHLLAPAPAYPGT